MTMRTIDDLTTVARDAFERAYRHEYRRAKCSRQDFAAGWLAALEHLGSRSSFRTASPAVASTIAAADADLDKGELPW
jgi:hypothetical protein